MVKKVLVVSLALSVIAFSQMAGTCLAETSDSIEQAKQNVISLIDAGDLAGADSATNKLITDFANSPGVDEAVHQIAVKYQDVKNYQKEIELSRSVVTNWPQSSHAVWAQMDIVMANLLLGNETAAQAELGTLVSLYKDDPNLPRTLYIINRGYRSSAFGQILKQQFNSGSPAKIRLAISSADILAKIESGDCNTASSDVDKLVAEFSSDSDLPKILLTIAQQLGWRRQYGQASNICQRIIQDYPSAGCVTKAKLCLVNADVLAKIESRDYAAAGSSVDKMIAEFSSDADLPRMLLAIAKQLSWKYQYEQAGNICSQIVQKYPSSPVAAQAQQCMSKAGQVANIISALIEAGDYAKVSNAVDDIITKFGDEADTPSTIYGIAGKLETAGQFAFARQVYEQIIWRYPQDVFADMSRMGVQRTKVLAFDESGD